MTEPHSKKRQAFQNLSGHECPPLLRRHLVVGWWSLVVFLTMGIFLESLHGFKLAWYVGVHAETRRFMWTLAHTHGTLLSIIHIGFGLSVAKLPESARGGLNWSSLCLIGAGVLMPAGFFLGGLYYYSGDPGLGILLVPPGGVLLLIAVGLVASAVTRRLH